MKSSFFTSKNNELVNDLLVRLEPKLNEMLVIYNKFYLVHFDREMTKKDEHEACLGMVAKLIKSFCSYTLPTDTIISLDSKCEKDGSLSVDCSIQRDGEEYSYHTHTIYAGGSHTLQCLHYRYLTSTKLPKTGGTPETIKEVNNEIKKLNKIEQKQKDVERYEFLIKRILSEIETEKSTTDEEIISKGFVFPTHENINVGSHIWDLYKDDKKGYDEYVKIAHTKRVKNFRNSTDFKAKVTLKEFKKSLQKEQQKLSLLLEA